METEIMIIKVCFGTSVGLFYTGLEDATDTLLSS